MHKHSQGNDEAKASEMEHAIRKHCTVHFDEDPAFYTKLSEKLEKLIEQHRDNWKTMATDHEAQLRTLRDDLETRGANAQQERQKLETLLADKTKQLSASEETAQQRQSKMAEVQRELNALKENINLREDTLKANISQLELERDGLKERLKLVEEEVGRVEELRKQALADYERGCRSTPPSSRRCAKCVPRWPRLRSARARRWRPPRRRARQRHARRSLSLSPLVRVCQCRSKDTEP